MKNNSKFKLRYQLLVLILFVLGSQTFLTAQVQVSVFNFPNLNGSGGCSDENENLISIVNAIPDFTVDGTISSFADPVLLANQLAESEFFFMTDMESQDPNNTAFLPVASRASFESWVSTGGVMVMTGTFGSKDTDFLNLIFSWDLTTVSGSSWTEITANTSGTPFEGIAVPTLPNLSATDAVNKNTVPNFTTMWGTDSNAVVAVIQYGAGTVIFMGYDFYNTGVGCPQYTSDWVQIIVPAALEYASDLAVGAITNATYTSSDYTATMSDNGNGYWVAVPTGSVVPTIAEIIAGVDYGSVTVVASGSNPMTASVDQVFNITGLSPGATYDFYFVGSFLDTNDDLTYTEVNTETFATLNNDPTITAIVNQNVCPDTATGALSFTVGDVETLDTSLIVTGTSSDTEVIPSSNIVISGTGATRTVTVTPATGKTGLVTITLTVTDANDGTNESVYTVEITDVTAPVADILSLTAITAECEVTSLSAPTATDNCGGIVTVTNDA
ncbi:MAG: hypothetical protein COB60_12600, partial [Flavobacteriaceae bacterium]